jgi:hypothetical protein
LRWRNAPNQKAKTAYFSEIARAKDRELDDASSGVSQILDVHARLHPAGTELGDRARRLSALFFPLDLKTVTNASFAEELAATRRIVERANDEAAEVAKVPGLTSVIAILDERSREFEAVLEREKPSAPSYAEAAVVGAEAERRMAELVLGVLFVHRGDAPEAAKRRAELLEPYVIQQESLRDLYRRRLTPADVDPETGEELPGAAASPEPEPA